MAVHRARTVPVAPRPHPARGARRARRLLTLAIIAASATTAGASVVQPGGRAAARVAVTTPTGQPLGGAQVRVMLGSLLSARGETDDRGVALLERLPAESVWVQVRRLGYRPDSARVLLRDREPLPVVIALQPLAVELAPVLVVGRGTVTGPMAGFYRRQQTGSGRFFTYDDIVRRNPVRLTDLLRTIPGFRVDSRGAAPSTVRIRGSRCSPLVFLDGQALMAGEVDIDAWDPRSFDGIEVYSGPASVPVEFQRNQRASSSCGTLILWSRMEDAREPRRGRNEPTPAARIAALLDSGRAFVPAHVDRQAAPDSLRLVRPDYPDSLLLAGAAGRVIAEFVVGTGGEALMETFSAVTATHPSLVPPVRRAVRAQRFTPAVRGGRVVQQVVQLPFDFIPDSTLRRKP